MPKFILQIQRQILWKGGQFYFLIFPRSIWVHTHKNLFILNSEIDAASSKGVDDSPDRRYAELMTTCIANTRSWEIPASPRGVDDSTHLRYAASAFTPNQTIHKLYLSACPV